MAISSSVLSRSAPRPLREHRLLAGLNRRELAALAGLHVMTVCRVERGQRVQKDTRRRLAQALGVPVNTIREFSQGVGVPEPAASLPTVMSAPSSAVFADWKATDWLATCALALARRHAPALVPTIEYVRGRAAVPISTGAASASD